MKSAFKRTLFVGISVALVALTVRRYNQDAEAEADNGELDSPEPASPGKLEPAGTPAPIPGDRPALVPPRRPAMAAPTVTFSGTVVRSGPGFALRETAGILYPLDFAGRARPSEYEDDPVRITGKLDLDTRLLYVDAIEPVVMPIDLAKPAISGSHSQLQGRSSAEYSYPEASAS
jgi:hypothetical protein